jgi:hypothetical protein
VKQPNRLEDWQREIELTPASKEQSKISNQKKSAGSLRAQSTLEKHTDLDVHHKESRERHEHQMQNKWKK